MTTHGEELIDRCKQHVIATMRTLAECVPDGPGLKNKDIETACGFALDLRRQDGWLTWSLLMSLVQDKKIDFTTRAKKRTVRYFRLVK
ncbi:MAG TPA: hypothetical protein VNM47_01855 [Terriglobia bacterium]|nr:hypothetical protein [Terriglobia bacterium]